MAFPAQQSTQRLSNGQAEDFDLDLLPFVATKSIADFREYCRVSKNPGKMQLVPVLTEIIKKREKEIEDEVALNNFLGGCLFLKIH